MSWERGKNASGGGWMSILDLKMSNQTTHTGTNQTDTSGDVDYKGRLFAV